MDGNSSPKANSGAGELGSASVARRQAFRSTASKLARSGGTSNGTSTRGRASPRSAPYEAHLPAQAMAGWNGPFSLMSACESSGSLTQDGLGRQDMVMVDARGNHLRFPYHTQYPPIRVVESGAEGVRGGSVRNRALAPRPGLDEAGEGGDGDSRADSMQLLSLTASQTASLDSANGALTNSTINVGQPRCSSPAQAPDTIPPSSLDPITRQPHANITFTGPYYLPNLMNSVAAAETSYVSPYPPLQQTLNARAPAPPANEPQIPATPPHHPKGSQPVSNTASPSILPYPPPKQVPKPQTATSHARPIANDAFHNVSTSTQSSASSASTLQGLPDNGQPLTMSQLEQLDFPDLDDLTGVPADIDPLGTGTANDNALGGLDTSTAVNDNDADWLDPRSWDDFPVDMDFDFDFTSMSGF